MAGKARVTEILKQDGFINPHLIDDEVDWFYDKLGMHAFYFTATPHSDVARHITTLFASKLLRTTSKRKFDLMIEREHDDRAMFVIPSRPESDVNERSLLEQRIEREYMSSGYRLSSDPKAKGRKFRMQVYRSGGFVAREAPGTRLRMYFLQKPTYKLPNADRNHTELADIADLEMLERCNDNTKKLYQDVIKRLIGMPGPIIELFPSKEKDVMRLVVCFRSENVHSYFSSLGDVYASFGLRSSHKYVEVFSNGMTIFSLYLMDAFPSETMSFELKLRKVMEQASQTFALPRSALTNMFVKRVLTQEECVYAYVCWKFTYQFMSRYPDSYYQLCASTESADQQRMLISLKSSLRKDAVSEGSIYDAIKRNPELVKVLFQDFADYHQPTHAASSRRSSRITEYDNRHGVDLEATIRQRAHTDLDARIFTQFLSFNRHTLKTNFFKKNKVSLSFRLDPLFLNEKEYPVRPHGIFLVVGATFYGFHIRFTDIARGGVRIIRSANAQAYSSNSSSLFDENYNLALTQQKKNKDLPEGGSKGTVLLSLAHQDKDLVAFRQYVHGLLDLILLDDNHSVASSNAKGHSGDADIVDHLQQTEILFLGPDEGSANFMDWASTAARRRRYPYWKSFTTGKAQALGGIPHDTYGMTTRSVHTNVLGILGKVGLDEKTVHKMQTGGPDGDLGSNEIKISHDKTIAIVDGSGVLYDPEGIYREELERLAEERKMVSHFNKDLLKSKLSSKGFLVLCEDRNVTLPDGTKVENGMLFRNSFHTDTRVKADLFVPCGGRPNAVNGDNVATMFDPETKEPRFKFIVEGANLFFTQEARLTLEKAGVILIKDATANKGGVTSSSLEVLAALAFRDDEFEEHMMVKDPANPPAFYTKYVEDVQNIIQDNAQMEFDCIWRERERTGKPNCVITDEVSDKINHIHAQVQQSSLWENETLHRHMIARHCPPSLIEHLSLDTILERVPENYLRAILGCRVAAEFVYRYGIEPPEFAMFEFLQTYGGADTSKDTAATAVKRTNGTAKKTTDEKPAKRSRRK